MVRGDNGETITAQSLISTPGKKTCEILNQQKSQGSNDAFLRQENTGRDTNRTSGGQHLVKICCGLG